MIEQTELINRALKQGKVIIVLDALRFDAAQRFWDGKEEVKLVWSGGSETPQWLANTFKDYYDVAYFSANPFCSSVKNPYGWRGSNHFRLIVPVWDFGWRKVNGCYTVPPEEVVKAYRRWHEPAPAILHIMQPHPPFVYSSNPLPIPWVADLEREGVVKPGDVDRGRLYPYWVEKYGAEAVRKAYFEQAEYIINFVKEWIDRKGIPVVITSDHGELLGEKGLWGHPAVICNELRVVPWIERRC